MSNFIVCTFYTPSYEKYVAAWEQHAKASGVDYVIKAMPEKGQWNWNDCQKPLVIRDTLAEYPDKSVVWCDVDAIIVKYPELFDVLHSQSYDMAGFKRDIDTVKKIVNKKYTYKRGWNGSLVLGGTLWFNQSPNAVTILNAWIESCDIDPDRFRGEQDNLNQILDQYASDIGLKFFNLPVDYCFECPAKHKEPYRGREGTAVIKHSHASFGKLVKEHGGLY